MRGKSRVVKVLLPALCAVGLFVGLWWVQRRSAETFPLGQWVAYAWIDNQSLLVIRRDPYWSFYRLDRVTRRETPLPELTQRVRTYGKTFEMQVSPDGRWLLWEYDGLQVDKTGGRSQTHLVLAATLDGKQFVSSPIGSYHGIDASIANSFCWAGDSRHWLEFSCPRGKSCISEVKLHALDSSQTITASFPKPVDGVSMDGIFFCRGTRLFFAGEPTYFEFTTGDIANCTTLVELSALPNLAPIQRFGAPGQSEMAANTMTVSPDGRFFGRIEPFTVKETWMTRLQRYLHRTPTQKMHRLIVCDLDGRHSRTVGEPIASRAHSSEFFGALQWSPDGRYLSYTGDGVLTIVLNE